MKLVSLCNTFLTFELNRISAVYVKNMGYLTVQLVEALCYKPEGRAFDSRWGHLNFFFGFDRASNRNEYPEYFLGVKATGRWG
jgi:hypothetical protein